MRALEIVNLPPLMARASGRREVTIGLIDGPIAKTNSGLEGQNIHELTGASCSQFSSAACRHGTFVAAILVAKRGSAAPAICPGCSLLERSIFPEMVFGNGHLPSATPKELAAAIVEVVEAGARILNLSVSVLPTFSKGERELQLVLDYAAQRGVIVIAAAGNQGVVGSSVLTRHPWVIPVASCDLKGRPLGQSKSGRFHRQARITCPR